MNNLAFRPRTRLSQVATLLPTTAAVILAALATASLDRTGSPPTPPATRPAPASADRASIVLQLPDGTAAGRLEDTAAAREFARLLPLQLTLGDPMGQAKSGRLPTRLAVTDTEPVRDPEVGGIYYWPPRGHLAVLYDDLNQTVPPPGLVRLGTLTSGLPTVAAAGNRFTVTIEHG